MSTVEEDTVIAPWVGPTSCRNRLTVLILSTNVKIIEKISQALEEIHAKGNFRWKLIILQSFYLEEIVRQSDLTGKISIDFIVLGMDTRIFCLEWTKKALNQIHPDLRSRRSILVNASGLPVNGMAISTEDLLTFQTESKLDMLTSNVYKSEEALFLARRLLKYMEVSLGIKTGIPNLNV
ncbi:uncharacterized protein LOC113512882 [Galleria mellonella]|uniref:Uncharacterized protein LOC113512882 n=1 Tax=Galleria mellonella TaxID=7137 RepID=A0A6J1WN23_GALME|nr:uncharacterized protein LOC113512882 [Galleria mellonella]